MSLAENKLQFKHFREEINYSPSNDEIQSAADEFLALQDDNSDISDNLSIFYNEVYKTPLLKSVEEKVVAKKAKAEMKHPRFKVLLESMKITTSPKELTKLHEEFAKISPNYQRMINANLRLVVWSQYDLLKPEHQILLLQILSKKELLGL